MWSSVLVKIDVIVCEIFIAKEVSPLSFKEQSLFITWGDHMVFGGGGGRKFTADEGGS